VGASVRARRSSARNAAVAPCCSDLSAA